MSVLKAVISRFTNRCLAISIQNLDTSYMLCPREKCSIQQKGLCVCVIDILYIIQRKNCASPWAYWVMKKNSSTNYIKIYQNIISQSVIKYYHIHLDPCQVISVFISASPRPAPAAVQVLFKGIQLFVHEAEDPGRDAPQGIGKGILAINLAMLWLGWEGTMERKP